MNSKLEKWYLVKNHVFFHFLHLYKQKMKKIMIFSEVPFFQFRVHLDPILIKISRFHTLQQEKLVTKVILISLSWTSKCAYLHNSTWLDCHSQPALHFSMLHFAKNQNSERNSNFHERNDQWIQKLNFFMFFERSRFENQSKKA